MKKMFIGALLLLSFISIETSALSLEPAKLYQFSKKCPSERPFMGILDGDCIGCDFLGIIPIKAGHEKDFEICKNRETYKDFNSISKLKECPKNFPLRDIGGRCYSCNEETLYVLSMEDCLICPNREVKKFDDEFECYLKCPSKHPMRYSKVYEEETCHDCFTRIVDFDEEECSKCPNRKYVDGKCVLKKENQ